MPLPLVSDPFDIRPTARTKRNSLPSNPEAKEEEAVVSLGRFPTWLHRRLPEGAALAQTRELVEHDSLHTVCASARCPNRLECYARKTATFLVLGNACTRSCGFCSIPFQQAPAAPSVEEPQELAESVQKLGLRHAVITMVARDDLADGGASHLCDCIQAIRRTVPTATIEVLTSDFAGNHSAWKQIAEVKPEIWNYNIETVRRLTPRVRHKATYERTLELLQFAKEHMQGGWVKSGLMLGLGESEEEVQETLRDLHQVGCSIVTIGQYLQSDKNKLRVKAFVPPAEFEAYAEYGRSIGIPHMYCGPLIRSSYNADLVLNSVQQNRVQFRGIGLSGQASKRML